MRLKPKNILFFLLGNVILALGVCMNAKSQFGVGAIMTIPYALRDLTGFSIGVTSFMIYVVMVAMQFLLLGRQFALFQWFQLLASFLSSLLLQVFDVIMVAPQGSWQRLVFLLVGIFLTATGASLTIISNLVPGAPDGLAHAIGQVSQKGFGVGKNILDISCVCLVLLLGLVTGRGLFSIGIGTLLGAFLTGRLIALIHPLSTRLIGQ